jgi:hypothetical protein
LLPSAPSLRHNAVVHRLDDGHTGASCRGNTIHELSSWRVSTLSIFFFNL